MCIACKTKMLFKFLLVNSQFSSQHVIILLYIILVFLGNDENVQHADQSSYPESSGIYSTIGDNGCEVAKPLRTYIGYVLIGIV